MSLVQLLGIIRHTMTAAGTILTIYGVQTDGAKWQVLTGSLLALASIIWSIMDKSETPTTSVK